MPEPQISFERRVFEDLRERLVDRTRKNRLLHFSHGTRSSIIRIVDDVPERIVHHLLEDGQFRFRPLPAPADEPPDERTSAFQATLAKARLADEAYRTGLAAFDPDDPSATAKEAAFERALRNQVRGTLGLPHDQRERASIARRSAASTASNPRTTSHRRDSPGWRSTASDLLQTLLFADELAAKLPRIDTTAREVEQETGVSTLHLAIGFLELVRV